MSCTCMSCPVHPADQGLDPASVIVRLADEDMAAAVNLLKLALQDAHAWRLHAEHFIKTRERILSYRGR